VKGLKKEANGPSSQASVAILMSEKIDIKIKLKEKKKVTSYY
jgi:hypothetical protein